MSCNLSLLVLCVLNGNLPSRCLLGLHQPLPIPTKFWTKNSMDLITDLPLAQGFNTICMVVNSFSKAHFVLLSRLPTDIVSDRGVQFTSKF